MVVAKTDGQSGQQCRSRFALRDVNLRGKNKQQSILGEEALRYEGSAGEKAYSFKGTSDSGRRLLRVSTNIAVVTNNKNGRDGVHRLKASDFDGLPPDQPGQGGARPGGTRPGGAR